jgi:hypothetical protein
LWLPRLAQKSLANSAIFMRATGSIRLGVRHDFFEQTLLPQSVGGELIVNNGIDGDGSLRQPVRQSLLAGRKRLEAGGAQLNECGVADALDDDFVLWRCLAGSARVVAGRT